LHVDLDQLCGIALRMSNDGYSAERVNATMTVVWCFLVFHVFEW